MGLEEFKGSGRILVMDDEEPIRNLLKMILSELGYKPSFAANGEECLAQYASALRRDEKYDLVLMDLTIAGGLGGKETIAELLKLDPKAKAVVSSGYSLDPVMMDYKAFGFSGALGKPYLLNELAAELKRQLPSK